MGWDQAIDEMVEIKSEVAPKKPLYELTSREDKLLLFRIRERYRGYKEFKEKNKFKELWIWGVKRNSGEGILI